VSLPSGWIETKLREIADFVMGQAPPGEDCNFNGIGTPFVKAGEFGLVRPEIKEWTTRPLKLARQDDVLICVVGATAGKLNRGADCAIGRSVAAIRPSPVTSANFLFPRMKSEVARLRGASVGTAQGVISRDLLGGVDIVLPPLAEQGRIVAKLDALFSRLARARAELDHVSVEAPQIRRAALSEIFDSEENLIEFSEVLEDIQAGKNLKCTEQPPGSGEKGVVKVSAVSSERFLASESKTLPSSYQPPERDRILRGDLLIARASGSLDLVGRVALVESCPKNLYLSDKILRLVLRPDLKQWAYWFLRSPAGRRQIEDAASGISMHNVTQASIRKLRFPLPDDNRRQAALQRLNKTFACVDRLEAEAARARALIDRLEAAILTKAFKGELVPQDPNDEPASVLLERIRAQRTAVAPALKAKRRRRLGAVAE